MLYLTEEGGAAEKRSPRKHGERGKIWACDLFEIWRERGRERRKNGRNCRVSLRQGGEREGRAFSSGNARGVRRGGGRPVYEVWRGRGERL